MGGSPVLDIYISPKSLRCDGSGSFPGDIGGVWSCVKDPTAATSVMEPPGYGGKSNWVLQTPL